MRLLGILALPLCLTGCIGLDVRIVDTPLCPNKVEKPSDNQNRKVVRDRLVLVPYPKKPAIQAGVKDHNEIENILIKHINELHRVNALNVKRVQQYSN